MRIFPPSRRPRTLLTGLVVGAVTSLCASPASAQDGDLSLWTAAGLAVPTGELADVADAGPSIGIGASYPVLPRLRLQFDFGLDLLEGVERSGGDSLPDLRQWSYTVGLEYALVGEDGAAVHVLPQVAGGALRFDSDVIPAPDVVPEAPDLAADDRDLSETYPVAQGGVRVTVALSEHVGLQADVALRYVFTDEEETELLARASGAESGFASAVSLPVRAGLRFRF